jgi:hypothetical protein
VNPEFDLSDTSAFHRNLNRRIFSSLFLIAILASIAVLPYLIEILTATGRAATFWKLAPSVVTERALFAAIAIWIGVSLGPRLGLDAPVARDWLTGQRPLARHRRLLLPSMICGVCVAVLVAAGGAWLEKALMPPFPNSARHVEDIAKQLAAWKTVLASCSAGVIEELMFQFGAMTLFVWLGAKMTRRIPPKPFVFWAANFLAATLFGLIHLTNVAQLGIPITSGAILYVTLTNGSAGMVFGWLYMHFGLESAVLAHAVSDIVLKVILPMIATAVSV